jgi:excisionase family DNA binding protein
LEIEAKMKDLRKEFMTSREIAETLGLSREWVVWKIRHGEIPAVKIGHQYVVKRKDFEKFVKKKERKK